VLVELPGIETDALPGNIASELPARSVSVRLSPARYLRFRCRVLTASRAVSYRREPSVSYAARSQSNRVGDFQVPVTRLSAYCPMDGNAQLSTPARPHRGQALTPSAWHAWTVTTPLRIAARAFYLVTVQLGEEQPVDPRGVPGE
jgi:hypothetical protein